MQYLVGIIGGSKKSGIFGFGKRVVLDRVKHSSVL